jgi:uncharacterized iron-regulated membrane protein
MNPPFRRLIYQVHLWVGLVVSVVFVVAALTGLVLAFRSDLDLALNRRLLRVEPRAQRITVDAAVAAVESGRQGETVKFVRFPAEPDATFELQVGNREQVYVDPYTGVVLGSRDRDGGFLGAVDGLHRFLLGGTVGKFVVDACTLGGLFVLLTGIYLWVPKSARMLIAGSKLNFRLRGRASWLNWHMVTGLYAALLLVVSTGSALPIAYGWVKTSLFTLTGSKPAEGIPRSGPAAGRARVSLEAAWQAAHVHVPEFREALLRVPVAERDPMNFYFIAPDAPDAEARSTVYLDAYSGKLLRYTPHAQQSAGLKLFYLLKSIHLATWGGRVMQLLLALAMLTVPLLAVTGVWLYLLRFKKKLPAARVAARPAVARVG